MDWLNLHTSTLDSAEFIGSSPTERATWLCLQRYCIGQENGGRIADCAEWNDRRWQQLCRVTKREVMANCPLWTWDRQGPAIATLVVTFYPIEAEEHVKANRANGARGGRPKKTEQTGTIEKPHGLPLGSQGGSIPVQESFNQLVQVRRNETEGKEKKRKEKEGNTRKPGGGGAGGFSLSDQPEATKLRMFSVNALKNRQASTVWSAKEFAAFQAAGLERISDDEFHEQFDPLAKYYAAEVSALREMWRASKPDAEFRRRDLLTLLNNWAGEVDRAREWCQWHEKKTKGDAGVRL
jgi:hypothetical protein